jgi:hypothetical protein
MMQPMLLASAMDALSSTRVTNRSKRQRDKYEHGACGKTETCPSYLSGCAYFADYGPDSLGAQTPKFDYNMFSQRLSQGSTFFGFIYVVFSLFHLYFLLPFLVFSLHW